MFWLMGRDEEAQRIRAAQRGDASAFEALMAEYEQTIYAVALRMCGNREDAQDMVQETMLRIFRSIGGFKGNSKFSTWIYRITTNVCLDEFRRKRRRNEQSFEGLTEAGEQFADDVLETPEAHQERTESAQHLQAALLQLPSDLRMAIVLRDVKGFAYDEIAQLTGANLGTVKSRISRARGRLRKIIERQKSSADAI